MASPENLNLNERACALTNEIAGSSTEEYGVGTLTPSVYDSAWVSMVKKETEGEKIWLFPESFKYILEQQNLDGSWESYSSEIDGIVNTLAALLSLITHKAGPCSSDNPLLNDIESRISRAVVAIGKMLQAWKVAATNNCAFELIVPAHLELLAENGVHLEFDGKSQLMKTYHDKISRLNPEQLSGQKTSTILHSLEAFPHLNFNGIRHHTVFGSMFASPSSTAAYLMRTSHWDDEAERYLRWAIDTGSGKGNGSVPSVFPTTIFEMTWAMSNLLEGGFSIEDLPSEALGKIRNALECSLQQGGGITGPAPKINPDLDITAKSISILQTLGGMVSVQPMIAAFEAETHFRVYPGERDLSLSANCHALKALVAAADRNTNIDQIVKVTRFLCRSGWTGKFEDKWNVTAQYSRMTSAQALIALLACWDSGQLHGLPDDLLQEQIPIMLFEILIQTMQDVNAGGPWGIDARETSAYAVMTLCSLLSFPWPSQLAAQVERAIDTGRKAVEHGLLNNTDPEYLWIAKVSYGSRIMGLSYALTALNIPSPTHRLGERAVSLIDTPLRESARLSKYYGKISFPAGEPQWMIQASLFQSYLFIPILKRERLDVFPRLSTKFDRYFEIVLPPWALAGHLKDACLSPQMLLEMMTTSVIFYEADTFIEEIVRKQHEGHLDAVKEIIYQVFEGSSDSVDPKNGNPVESPNGHMNTIQTTKDADKARVPNSVVSDETINAISLDEIRANLENFVLFTMRSMKHASEYDRQNFQYHLRSFLLAQIGSVSSNTRLAKRRSRLDTIAVAQSDFQPYFEWVRDFQPYFEWVRGTAAVSVGCIQMFALLTCMIGQDGTDCFPDIEQKFLAQGMCLHLATMSRMYNDYSSLHRDRTEVNLNSLDFPEFGGGRTIDIDPKDVPRSEAQLLQLAKYEWKCAQAALTQLNSLVEPRVSKVLKGFCNANDLFGQLYRVKDLGFWVQK